MKNIRDKVFIVENFISNSTAKLLVDSFSNNLRETVHAGIYSGPGQGEGEAFKLSGEHKLIDYDGKNDIAIDILTGLCPSMEKTMSNVFNKNLQLKSISYIHMKAGGKNSLHYDNSTEENKDDYSGLLYLSDTYVGGSLNFPEQSINIEPSIGDFICFIGTEDMKHEVIEVSEGNRVNLVCFFKEKTR